MRDTIDIAREAGWPIDAGNELPDTGGMCFKTFEALVRADEREQGQKWFDAVTAQHKQLILAEREACERAIEDLLPDADRAQCAEAIRARGGK